ncbi:LacI family DNA-binding transcriptional regulator [Paenibacillus contaminans]|nr:LacI family DNA-binding transcriptional regulator [Paenibacillus contaminans]
MAVTKKDIADYLGISRTAVSLVLNDTPSSTVSEETRKKILQAAKELGYAEVSPKLCYILYNRPADDPRYMNDLRAVEETASAYNYRVLFMNVKAAPEDFIKLQRFLRSQEVSGFIVSGDIDEQIIELIVQSKVPYVFYGGTLREGVNVVVNDDKKLAYNATKYLLSLGHRRIACLTGSLDLMTHVLSIEGYKQAYEEADLPVDKTLVQVGADEDGYELCKRMQMLDIPFTAAFCANTVIQFGVLQRLRQCGISVPQEVSLIGSGMSELVKASFPQLTTYYVYPQQKGILVKQLIEKIEMKQFDPAIAYLSEFTFYAGETVAVCK